MPICNTGLVLYDSVMKIELHCRSFPPDPEVPFEESMPITFVHGIRMEEDVIIGDSIIKITDSHRKLAKHLGVDWWSETPEKFTHGQIAVLGLFDYEKKQPIVTYEARSVRGIGPGEVDGNAVAHELAAFSATALISIVRMQGLHIPGIHVINQPTYEPTADLLTHR